MNINKMLGFTAASFGLVFLGSVAGQIAVASEAKTETASILEASAAPESSQIEMRFDEGSLAADVTGAPLSKVAKRLQEVTGATVVLAGDTSGPEEPVVWAKVKSQPFDKALTRLLKGFSYSSHPVAGSDLPKITIYLEVGEDTSEAKPTLSSSDSIGTQLGTVTALQAGDWAASEGGGVIDVEAVAEEDTEAGSAESMEHPGDTTEEMAESEPDPEAEVANLPYDLDELFELPPQPVSENEEDYAEWESRTQESRLNRSMSAIDSQHSHIRRMAVDELVSTKDPRATSGIVHAAMRENASADERTLAAEALWRHAADLEFNTPSAIQSLQQLSTDSNSAVADMAKRAIADMERYQRLRR